MRNISSYAIALLLIVLLAAGCGITQMLPPPQADELVIDGGAEVQGMAVVVDGLHVGYVPQTITVIENYPNYLQVGPWRMIFIPPMTMDTLYLGQKAEHEALEFDCIGTADIRIE